jgi:DNA-binding IclR family transcriptional regulator
VHLATLEQSNIIYLFNLESLQAIRTRSYVGARKPAFCTSEGRVLLAHEGPDVLTRALKDGLEPRTSHTQTDPSALRKILETVRREGYAIDDEESEEGMRGLAAPVRNHTGDVIAAIGIAGPVQRLSKRTIRTFVTPVIEIADAVSARLGFLN